jgi:CheY-like chemotaxis protein
MKILMVDDDADDRTFFQIAFDEYCSLAEKCPTLEFAKNGVELMDYLSQKVNNKEALPDLIFLDLNMPLKNGWEALKEIRSNPALNTIVIDILTTSTAAPDKVFAQENGARNYIEKPFQLDKWIELIKSSFMGVGGSIPR